MLSFNLSSSLSGNLGFRRTSAITFIASGANSYSTELLMEEVCNPTPMFRFPPIPAISSAICLLVFVVLPSSSKSAKRSLNQTWFSFSSIFPVFMLKRIVALGIDPYGIITNSSPLSKETISFFGKVKFLGSPPFGGISFSCAQTPMENVNATIYKMERFIRIVFYRYLPKVDLPLARFYLFWSNIRLLFS